jgi:glycerol-3-phosphate dehydrogenase subunit B
VRGELKYDAVVIGAGTAGLVAGARLAEGGARVCVLAKGVGSTHLAPGTIDVLGYAPERVTSPAAAIDELAAARPDHPYARLGSEAVAEAVRWFSARVDSGPRQPLPEYRYVGDLERNILLPTAVGALRPSALVPETMAAGDSASYDRVCIVGTRSLRDFHPALCAANLRRAGIDARSVEIEIEVERADQNTLELARRFDDPAWRAAFAGRLALKLQAHESVGLPAMLGIRDPHGAWSDVQHRLGRPVFEIPGLPPSVPGMRLYEILRSTLRNAGGRLVLGAEVVSCERDGSRVVSVAARSAGHDAHYGAPWFVLASGGFGSGGIELDSRWAAHERVFGLELRGLPGPGQPRFVGDYLAEQPMARVGVAVDGELRAEGADNVVVVGAALPGAVPWREGSGEGIALASGSHAAQLVLARSGAPAGAAA